METRDNGAILNAAEQAGSIEKPPFALDGYGYTRKDLDGFVARLSTVTSTGSEVYRQILEGGGWKSIWVDSL